MEEQNTFSEELLRITRGLLEDGEIEQALHDKLLKGFNEAFDSCMRWGEVNKAIESRMKEVLVPFIEKYDMNRYVVKLDEILSQLIEQSPLGDNKRVLENFSRIVKTPDARSVTLDEVFEEYCRHVESDIDTEGMEIDYDDEPTYCAVEAVAEIGDVEKRRWDYGADRAELTFRVDDYDGLAYKVELEKYSWSDGYYMRFELKPSIVGLATMNGFEAYLSALCRRGIVLLADEKRLEESVTPEDRPEASFS